MLYPGLEGARLIRVPKGDDALAHRIAAALARPTWREGAGVLKANDDGAVFDAVLSGTPVVVKTQRVRTLGDRLKGSLGVSRLMRQWNGAVTLDRVGVRAAMPLALLRGFGDDGGIVETLVLERVEGRSLLEHLRDEDLTHEEWRALIESMAVDLEAMWLRAFNRDHKPSNLIVVREGDAVRAVVVDTVGVRRLRGFGTGSNPRLARMLASLWIEAWGVGCPPSVGCAYRLVCRVCDAPTPKGKTKPGWTRAKGFGAARTMWGMAWAIVRDHGDPTPKDSPFPERHGG